MEQNEKRSTTNDPELKWVEESFNDGGAGSKGAMLEKPEDPGSRSEGDDTKSN